MSTRDCQLRKPADITGLFTDSQVHDQDSVDPFCKGPQPGNNKETTDCQPSLPAFMPRLVRGGLCCQEGEDTLHQFVRDNWP